MQARTRGISFTLLAVALLALAGTVPAHARIVPDERRIGKVKLDMSEQTVREKLGRPDRVARVRFDVRRLVYRDEKLRVDIYRKRVLSLKTTNPRERTPSGVGVGSTRAELRRAEGDRLQCEGNRREGACWIYPRGNVPNDPTEFAIAEGRVVSVRIYPGGAPL